MLHAEESQLSNWKSIIYDIIAAQVEQSNFFYVRSIKIEVLDLNVMRLPTAQFSYVIFSS